MHASGIIKKIVKSRIFFSILIAVLILMLLFAGISIYVVSECRVIGDRNIYMSLSKEETAQRESVDLVKVNIDDELVSSRIEVLAGAEKVDYYGYAAKAYYVFWQDELTWVYFLIQGHQEQEATDIFRNLSSKLEALHAGEMQTDEQGKEYYQGFYPVKFLNRLHGRGNDIYSQIFELPLIKDMKELANQDIGVQCGINHFPAVKENWEMLTGREEPQLADDNTVVVEYKCNELYEKAISALNIEKQRLS